MVVMMDTDTDRDTDRDTDDNRKVESTLSGSYSKPHLDPTAMFALSTSVPNCSRVTPPPRTSRRWPRRARPPPPTTTPPWAARHRTPPCCIFPSASPPRTSSRTCSPVRAAAACARRGATSAASLLLRHLEDEASDLGDVAKPVRGLQQRLELSTSDAGATRDERSWDTGARMNNDAELTSRPPPANELYGVGKEASELAGRGRAGTAADDAELICTEQNYPPLLC